MIHEKSEQVYLKKRKKKKNRTNDRIQAQRTYLLTELRLWA